MSEDSLPTPESLPDVASSGPVDDNGGLRGVLLSIHLTSNRPDEFRTFLDRLEQATDDMQSVEVVLKIDDTDERMNALLAEEVKRRPFRITCISTPLSGGFYELWRSYDELLRICDPHAYFVVGLNDEMYFTEKGWDTRLRRYVGLYPDHIYRLRTSIHRERNTFDYWEASCAGDLSPIMTKRWLDLCGGWCPCNGPDSFQNAVAFYFGCLNRHDTFNRPYRERVVHDIEFGGYGANNGLSDPEALRRRTRGALAAWFTLVSYPMQQEAARRAQRLLAHIAAARLCESEYEVVDDSRGQTMVVWDRTKEIEVWRARYGIGRARIGWTNFIRKFNYPYYAGGGEPWRRWRWANVTYYVLTRHDLLNRARQVTVVTAGRAATRLAPFPAWQRYLARPYLRDAEVCIREGDRDRARSSWRQAHALWPGCDAGWLRDGPSRLRTIEHGLSCAAPGSTRLGRLARHLRARSPESCADALTFAPEEAERLRMAWLAYTVDQPFNLWTLLPSIGIRRVAVFGGEGWGLTMHRQLEPAGVICVALIDNDATTRRKAIIPARYFSLPEYLAAGERTDAVLSSLRGDHDREVLPRVQATIGLTVPVLSWKMLLSLLADAERVSE